MGIMVKKFTVGVVRRNPMPTSSQVYYNNLTQGLTALGCKIVPISALEHAPDNLDIVWHPSLGMHPLPAVPPHIANRLVTTILGLRVFYLPPGLWGNTMRQIVKSYLLRWRIKHSWLRYGSRVGGIVAISQFGADEIKRVLPVANTPVQVAYLGVEYNRFYSEETLSGQESTYFLTVVAEDEPRKNLRRVISAYSGIDFPKPDLVIKINTKHHLGELPPGVRLVTHYLPDEELIALYRHATAFIFPSLFENFGLPIIEAMAAGCPVITAKTTACVEIAGQAAMCVDPTSIIEIREAMQVIGTDSVLRAKLRARGLIHARAFTWKQSTETHLAFFEEIIESI